MSEFDNQPLKIQYDIDVDSNDSVKAIQDLGLKLDGMAKSLKNIDEDMGGFHITLKNIAKVGVLPFLVLGKGISSIASALRITSSEATRTTKIFAKTGTTANDIQRVLSKKHGTAAFIKGMERIRASSSDLTGTWVTMTDTIERAGFFKRLLIGSVAATAKLFDFNQTISSTKIKMAALGTSAKASSKAMVLLGGGFRFAARAAVIFGAAVAGALLITGLGAIIALTVAVGAFIALINASKVRKKLSETLGVSDADAQEIERTSKKIGSTIEEFVDNINRVVSGVNDLDTNQIILNLSDATQTKIQNARTATDQFLILLEEVDNAGSEANQQALKSLIFGNEQTLEQLREARNDLVENRASQELQGANDKLAESVKSVITSFKLLKTVLLSPAWDAVKVGVLVPILTGLSFALEKSVNFFIRLKNLAGLAGESFKNMIPGVSQVTGFIGKLFKKGDEAKEFGDKIDTALETSTQTISRHAKVLQDAVKSEGVSFKTLKSLAAIVVDSFSDRDTKRAEAYFLATKSGSEKAAFHLSNLNKSLKQLDSASSADILKNSQDNWSAYNTALKAFQQTQVDIVNTSSGEQITAETNRFSVINRKLKEESVVKLQEYKQVNAQIEADFTKLYEKEIELLEGKFAQESKLFAQNEQNQLKNADAIQDKAIQRLNKKYNIEEEGSERLSLRERKYQDELAKIETNRIQDKERIALKAQLKQKVLEETQAKELADKKLSLEDAREERLIAREKATQERQLAYQRDLADERVKSEEIIQDIRIKQQQELIKSNNAISDELKNVGTNLAATESRAKDKLELKVGLIGLNDQSVKESIKTELDTALKAIDDDTKTILIKPVLDNDAQNKIRKQLQALANSINIGSSNTDFDNLALGAT